MVVNMPGEARFGTYPRSNNHRMVENNRENSHNNSKDSPQGIFENGRFCHTACNLLGCVFRVQTNEGRVFEGVLQAFNKDFEVALSLVHEITGGNSDDELPREGSVREKMIFSADNIVTWTTVADLDKNFATDAEISRFNGEIQEKKLEAWEPEAHDEDHIIDDYEEHGGGIGGGWTADDMFKRNKENFGVVSTYQEDLSKFMNVDPLDDKAPDYHLKLKEAERIARAIEANPASKKAADLENDDEERDIILPRSSVSSVESAATPNNTDTAKTYVPPNMRRNRGGGHQTDRGGARNNARSCGISNAPRGGGPKTPRDEYTGGNVSYYNSSGGRMGGGPGGSGGNQKYQFQQPPPHISPQQQQPPPNIQHERSPGAAQNNNFSNDWERRPQRRDGGGGGGGGSGYVNRQYAQHGGEGGGPNTSRRTFKQNPPRDREQLSAEFKKFGTDFQLVTPHQQMDGRSTQGAAGGAATHQTMQPQPSQQQQSAGAVISPNNQTVLSQPQPQGQQHAPPQHQSQPLPPRHYQPQRSPPRQQNQPQMQKSPDSNAPKMPATVKNMSGSSSAAGQNQPQPQQHQPQQAQMPPPSRLDLQRQQPMQNYLPQSASDQDFQQRPLPQLQQQTSFEQRPPSVNSSRVGAPPTPTDSEKSEPTLDIRKSKLNPDAKEFCPSTQFYRPTPVQTPAAGSYPVQVQSPQNVMQPLPPMSPQQQQPPQMYGQNMAAAYPPPAASNTVTFLPGNNVPFYTINQPTMAVLHTNGNYRQRKSSAGNLNFENAPQPLRVLVTPGQPQAVAAAAATGQPIMTAPYPGQPYFVHYPAGVSAGQPQPQSTYQPNYIVNTAPARMQYIVHPSAASGDGSQPQPVYMIPQLVQVTANPYQTATAVVNTVPPPGSVPQHPGAPPSVPPPSQQAGNNNSHNVGGHTQTPPAPQSQPPNSNAAVVGMQAYPPSANTPQSPQYPVPPSGGYQMVVLPPGCGYAPQMYGSQNALAAAAAAAGQHHGHVHPASAAGYPAAQAHYVPADAAAAQTAYVPRF